MKSWNNSIESQAFKRIVGGASTKWKRIETSSSFTVNNLPSLQTWLARVLIFSLALIPVSNTDGITGAVPNQHISFVHSITNQNQSHRFSIRRIITSQLQMHIHRNLLNIRHKDIHYIQM